MLTPRKLTLRILTAFLLLAATAALCVMSGTEKISLMNVFKGAGAVPGSNIDYEIFFGVRLPRVMLAAMVGAALAGAGVILQAILRNPLADPFILGISSGAGFGAVIAIIAGFSFSFMGGSPIMVFALGGALGTVWLVWTIGRFTAKSEVTSLLLAGVVVNAFFSAMIMFLTSIAKSEQMQEMMFWLMGNISEISIPVILVSMVVVAAGLAVLWSICHELNVLSFGESQAMNLGIDPGRVRLVAFAAAAIITAAAVSLSGLIGFVGLIVPHGVRLVLGPDHRQLLPISAIIGAAFLILADTVARTIVAPAQLPVGVITALAGGPFFLVLLARYTRKISWFAK